MTRSGKMRWINRDKRGSVESLAFQIVDRHISYLISSSADAGWMGASNAGMICDSLESGLTPDFNGGGNSNAVMIRQIELLSVRDKGFSWLFEGLSRMQRLCLFAAVLAEGRRDARGIPPSNVRIAAELPVYAAELHLGPAHSTPTEKTFNNHVSEGRKRFISKVTSELVVIATNKGEAAATLVAAV